VILTLQALRKTIDYREIAYATSADVTGETSRVVGYAGLIP
jgi:AmmeMemoRadiSam system protein B